MKNQIYKLEAAIKKSLFIGAILFLAGSFISCNHGNLQKENDYENQTDSGTYLIITDARVRAARSINPNIPDTQKSDILNSLTDFTLKATKSGSSTETVLATAQSIDELTSKKISITAGQWFNMTLSAKWNIGTSSNPYYVNFSDVQELVIIKEGQENKVSFELKTNDNGGLSITMNFDGNADKVEVSLKTAKKEALTTSRDKTITNFSTKTVEGKSLKSCTYSVNRTDDTENLPYGTYYLSFKFYKTGYPDVLNTLSYFVNIEAGFETVSELTVDLNEVKEFSVGYEYYVNESKIDVPTGETFPSGVTVKTGLLPEQLYISKTAEVALPTMGYTITDGSGNDQELVFGGWYKDNSFAADKKITGKLNRADSSITTLYALFYEPAIYVDADAPDGGSGWSATSPLNSVQAAVNKIQNLNNPNTEWGILVNGLVDECVTIVDPAGGTFPAEELYLVGCGTDCGIAGENNANDTILSINTKTSVILQDFTIKPTTQTYTVMGETGLALCVQSNVTLIGDTTIDGQNDNGGNKVTSSIYKGAVYVPAGGTLTMHDNATICNWKVCYGGGINVDGGTVVMNDNSSITKCASNFGGAIYMTSGSVTMNNYALIGGDSFANGCSATYGGGGVCIKGGTFEMNNSAGISNCTVTGTDTKGGGVYMEGGQFTMNDGTIGNNYAEGTFDARCGGVYLDKGALFTMEGGCIANNIAKVTATTDLSSCNSGGVYLDGNETDGLSTFDMKGGLISGNEIRAKDGIGKGRGVYVCGYTTYAGGIFKISGDDAVIEAHSNINHGEDIYLETSSKVTVDVTLTGGTEFTVTPGEFNNNMQILDGERVSNEYDSFILTQPDNSEVEWRIRSDGTITYYEEDADGHEYVDLGLTSGTLWSTKNYGQDNYNLGGQGRWTTFDYGDGLGYSNPVWGEKWSIASAEEWQELLTQCYWEKSDEGFWTSNKSTRYYVYNVYKAKDDADKGKVGPSPYYSPQGIYDANKDICIQIINVSYPMGSGTATYYYYWPQIFVDSTWENQGAASYSPKPPVVDLSTTAQPKFVSDWTSAPSSTNSFYRLVISKNRTLVVTPNGDDSHSGLNALNSNALQTMQGAINKIQDTDGSDEIDWTIFYFGEIPDDQKTISGYDSSKVKSLTIYSVTGTGSSTTKTAWDINSQGTIYRNVVGPLISQISAMTASGTITAQAGVATADDLVAIADALNDLAVSKPDVEVTLDLSALTGVTSVSDYSYSDPDRYALLDGNTNLVEITLPSSLNDLDNIFRNSSKLKTINIPGTITNTLSTGFCKGCVALEKIALWNSTTETFEESGSFNGYRIEKHAIYAGNTLYTYYGKAFAEVPEFAEGVTIIQGNAFDSCSITSVVIPDTVTWITTETFVNCSNLSSVVLPSGLSNIQTSTFYNCTSLSSVTIPSTITTINTNAFANCTALTTVNYLGTEEYKNEHLTIQNNSGLPSTGWVYQTSVPTGFVSVPGNGSNVPNMLVGKNLITQAEYEQYMVYHADVVDGSTYKPSTASEEKATTPVSYITFVDAVIYCNRRSEAEGLNSVYKIGERDNLSACTAEISDWLESTYNLDVEVVGEGPDAKYCFAWDGTKETDYYNSWDSIYDYGHLYTDEAANGYRLATWDEIEYIAEWNDENESVINGYSTTFREWLDGYAQNNHKTRILTEDITKKIETQDYSYLPLSAHEETDYNGHCGGGSSFTNDMSFRVVRNAN